MKYTIKQNEKIASDYCNNIPKAKPVYAIAYTNRRCGDFYDVIERRKPIKGVLSNEIRGRYTYCVFIPMSKTGEFMYYKATEWHNYMYADTYKEAVELYNSLVKQRIDVLKSDLKATYKDFIKPRKRRKKKARNLTNGKEKD